ncbi:hypothetical protein HU200_029845 [Digitaria exilis]|uniref:DDT domain-containing protein n=1 Tax=Digitaria exilis TaxID=1010633 RepID=A0A835EUI6_9POAL|nr:hypothetical protein HU200_029845 [Digitaria exilis]
MNPRRARFPRACHYRPNAAPPVPTPAPAPPPPRPRRSGNAGDETPEYRVVTPLVGEPESPSELPRWRLRGMWELASVLNFLHVSAFSVFRPLLNIAVEFTAEELEDAIITPNGTLDDVHMPLLKVAEGDLPIVVSHGEEIELYRALDPVTRLVILKAICDIRCEVYEEDPILGHRLYREIRRVEYVKEPTKKTKGKGSVPVISYQWEAVASNFEQFSTVAEKLFSSRNRTEVSLGKKLKFNYLPAIEKIHKKKEKLLKKQQREALLLDSYLTVNGLTSGRSRRERKRVTYTFDDYERSINEAIKTTKKSENVSEMGPSPLCKALYGESAAKPYRYQANNREGKAGTLDRSYRQRKRSQRYTKDFVEALSDIDPNIDSDDDIMGEAVYDEEYLRSKKQQKTGLSGNDEKFHLEQVASDGDNEVDHSLSVNEDADELQWYKRFPPHNPQETNLRSVDGIQIAIRRSKRSARPRINYQQYDISGTDTEFGKQEKCSTSDPDVGSDAQNDMEVSTTSQDREEEEDEVNKAQQQRIEKALVPSRESKTVQGKFLDLNELVPGGRFDDAPVLVKDERTNNGKKKCSAAH